jgi:sarcosine oxidase subunit alpha
MAELISLTVNGRTVRVKEGTSVAVAILMAGDAARISPRGEPRAPFCGMGICMECRATVNGVPQQPACQMVCRPGMEVVTG